MSDRYQGKPFLLLLEKYILFVIGELKPSDLENLEKMTPNLQRTFNQKGGWSEIIAGQMDLSRDDVDSIKRNWDENRRRAQVERKTVDPQAFAQFVADRLSGTSA